MMSQPRTVMRPVARKLGGSGVQPLGMQLPSAVHPPHNGQSGGVIPLACKPRVFDHMQLTDHLIAIADEIHAGGWDLAHYLLELLSRRVSTKGEMTERVAACFFEALAVRYSRLSSATDAKKFSPTLSKLPSKEGNFPAFLAVNAKTPFLHLAHLTATQAFLEALTEDGEDLFIHIVDVDVAGQGAQWPWFLQALADKRREAVCSIKRVRITGIGNDLVALQSTGKHLAGFAQSCRLPFEFIPLVHDLETLTPDMLDIHECETVGVNCVMQLHTLLRKGPEMLTNFLAMLESLAPNVITLAEADAGLNSPYFLDRFRSAWNFYVVLFDSLDATLPASSKERTRIEQDWYRPDILNVVAFEGSERFVRHQTYSLWRRFFEGNGFEILAPSRATMSQARCMLKLHHPDDGYRIVEQDGSVTLRWRDHPLYTVSAWKMAEMEEG